MAQYEPHLLLPTSDTQQMRSHSLRRGRAASDSTVYIKIIVAVRTKGEVETGGRSESGGNPKIAPNRSEESGPTPAAARGRRGHRRPADE